MYRRAVATIEQAAATVAVEIKLAYLKEPAVPDAVQFALMSVQATVEASYANAVRELQAHRKT
jgi:hypothetical protein